MMTARNFDRVPPFWNKQSSKLPFQPPPPRAAMAELLDNLASLRGLYQDLSAITDTSFSNVERLCIELNTHIHDFRKLLDKPAKNTTSRESVLSGKIKVADVEYSINQDFQQGTLQLADALNIDELEAAVLFLAAQEDSHVLDRPPLITAIMRFHERRHFLLECLRLICRESLDSEREATQPIMQETLAHILEIKNSSLQNASLFARKGLKSMDEIEKWLSLLSDQVQKASIVGQENDRDIMEAIEYQRQSLQQQHESLGAILFYLFKGTFTASEDFRVLIGQLKRLDRFDGLLIHYIPVTIAAFVQHGSPEGAGVSPKEARELHGIVTTAKDGNLWKLPGFHAAINALWLAIYSGWYFDDGASEQTPGVDPEKEAEERTKLFMAALDDGALDFMLAVCSSVNSEEWADPARTELVNLLLRESSITLPDSVTCSSYMKELLMENFEVFVESCIANMPDAVRMLKSEEDTQRLEQITALRDGLTSSVHRGLVEARTHLESLLMVISFAFEHRQDAAQEFWGDVEGNLYGFLQWASKRQTVPRVSAFCEMICSISEGEENAAAAHRFLTEEEKFMSSKLKRSTTMNWTQMFAELHLYSTRVTEKPSGNQNTSQGVMRGRKPDHVDMSEPESPVMLTCYLRLMGHLCKQSGSIREWMLQNESFKVIETLLKLCSGPIPSHLRATTFTTLSALMTDRTSAYGNEMWLEVDHWLSGGSMVASGKVPAGPTTTRSVWHEQQSLQKIGESFDQTNAFVVLMNALTTPVCEMGDNPLSLAFPESLGSSYRMPGIEPYVDFILGHALSRKIQDLNESQSRFLTYNCLEFVVTSLRTFKEDLVTVLSQPTLSSDSAATASTLVAYVRLHSFARVMEWLFNEDVLKALFAASQQDISEVAQASSDSVLVLTLLRSVEVMNLIMDLQSTYFNIVRPLIKSQASGNRSYVANSSLASFEDSVLNNLSLIPALCLYCGTGHEQLTVTSMTLLEKLTSSRKLNKMSSPELTKWQSSNKIVEVLASEVDVDSVARSLVSQMDPDPRELEYGSQAAGYVIRESLLALLNSCLGMITDRPTVAHLLLGFSCVGNILDVPSGGLLANQMSLMHAIIGFLQTYPEELEGSITSWTVHLKRMSFEVLKHLWSSKLATYFTLGEMRAQGFLMSMFAGQPIVGPNTLWNGYPVVADEFWLTNATSALAEFLLFRSHLFAYAATEIRSAAKVGSPTLQTGILSTLLGSSTLDNGESISHASVFDLFDFADLDVAREFNVPQLALLRQIAVDVCAKQEDDSLVLYNVAEIEELIQIQKSKLMAATPRPQDEEQFQTEAESLKLFILATNQSRQIQYNRYLALRSWAELITTIITCSVLDDATRPTFILHAIQMILPKIEIAIEGDSPEAIEFARLAETLIGKLASDISSSPASRSGDIIDEKLHQLFQVSTRGILLASGNVALREVLYGICSQYITRITSSSDLTHDSLKRHSQQVVRAAGPGLVEIICDDAYSGQEASRASALLVLNCLAVLDSQTDCVLAEMVSQSNYLSLFLDAVRSLPVELRNAETADTSILLEYYESLLALLQQLSQTKTGATFVLKAGLFESVRESRLFAADPDIGIDIDKPDALRKYYDLLLSVIRVIVSAVFSRGIHNEQIKAQTRAFIAENRPCMVGVFKRFAKIGGGPSPDHHEALCELVKSFMALITATNFLEFEDQEIQQNTRPALFS
ncbi:hypothetical protein N7462_004534 [Penicillium macrosclerotiorum]|uniref:uncharacterized protein n=1 Tax=Penicillium macrosclerotiorum TaxID=303699 RepID=UPI002548FE02|nr:uncharacterized protein N7462_004534 [Penicillium macrosclerotiorum]KAJ5690142.1 hypothetical protein N7462_004534 [Penicillium macrosclerotiorum]